MAAFIRKSSTSERVFFLLGRHPAKLGPSASTKNFSFGFTSNLFKLCFAVDIGHFAWKSPRLIKIFTGIGKDAGDHTDLSYDAYDPRPIAWKYPSFWLSETRQSRLLVVRLSQLPPISEFNHIRCLNEAFNFPIWSLWGSVSLLFEPDFCLNGITRLLFSRVDVVNEPIRKLIERIRLVRFSCCHSASRRLCSF